MTHSTPQVATLDAAYASCRDLHRTHGRSYYLATRLLPSWKRRHVHALYGFTRYTDDIVDVSGDGRTPPPGPERARRLAAWAGQFYGAVDGGQAPAQPAGPRRWRGGRRRGRPIPRARRRGGTPPPSRSCAPYGTPSPSSACPGPTSTRSSPACAWTCESAPTRTTTPCSRTWRGRRP